jgi:hypothetical protein
VSIRARKRCLALLLGLLFASAAYAATPSPAARAEIDHLLGRLERSGCEFFRNGRWYPARDARAHLERKYRYLLDKGLVATADDFITLAGSQSSMSGRPYQVRCGSTAAVPSAEWLTEELRRYRDTPVSPR